VRRLEKQTLGGFLIAQIKQIQGRVFENLLREADIDEFNGAQGRILFVLWQEDNLPIVELAERTGLAKTTLTSMLDRMELKGHIRRNFDPSDRLKIRITLTEQAFGLNSRYDEVSDRMNEIFYRGFSSGEAEWFERCLGKVLDNLKEYDKSKKSPE